MKLGNRPDVLSRGQVDALRLAGRHQLQRWDGVALDQKGQWRRADLQGALGMLKEFKDGCELHPVRSSEQERRRN